MMDGSRILRTARSKVGIVRDYALGRMNRQRGGSTVTAAAPAFNIADAPAAGAALEMPILAVDALVATDKAFADATDFRTWFENRRRESRQITQILVREQNALAAISDVDRQRAMLVADNVSKHIFNFLGSGPFVPVDEARDAFGLENQRLLSELQGVYEAILGRVLDPRNFRKRILSLGLIEPTGEERRGGAHRPASLYRFTAREPRVVEIL